VLLTEKLAAARPKERRQQRRNGHSCTVMDNYMKINNQMGLIGKGIVRCVACVLAISYATLALGQVGPVLPSQSTQMINALTMLVVTNTAVETNPPSGQQFGTLLRTNRFTFSYPNREALLADGWSFMATTKGTNRNTEITNPAQGKVIDYSQTAHPGSIVIPSDLGDMWDIDNENNRVNPTRNLLSRGLPPNWIEANLSVTWAPGAFTQQAGLALYQDDDNFILLSLGYANWRGSHPYDPVTQTWPGGSSDTDKEACAWVYSGTNALSYAGAQWSPHVHCYPFNIGGGNDTHVMRWDRYTTGDTNNCVLAWWSPNAGYFGDVGDVV
jgi:hypothetical protein